MNKSAFWPSLRLLAAWSQANTPKMASLNRAHAAVLPTTSAARTTDRVWPAIDAYLEIARKYDMDPIHLAMAFCTSRSFMTSVIFGATNIDQLKVILDGKDITLNEDILADINKAHKAHPLPY